MRGGVARVGPSSPPMTDGATVRSPPWGQMRDGESDRDGFPVPWKEKENPFARGGARGRKSWRDKGNRYPGENPGAGRNKGQMWGQGGSPGGIPRSKTWKRLTAVRPGKVADGRNQDEKLRRVRRIQGPETGSREQGKDFGFGIPEQGQRFRNVGAGAETPASGKQTGWKPGWNSPVKDMEKADGSETGKGCRWQKSG